MKNIQIRMQEVLDRGEKILVSGVPIGYPDLESTRRIVEIYIKSGIDVVEFSMPSLDPFIDTKVIADSNIKALNLEPKLEKYFETLLKIREDFPEEPFYMMAYAEIIRQYGFEQFVDVIKQIGIDSIELPDKDEEIPELVKQLELLLEKADIFRTFILHHPFDENYLDKIKDKAQGFLLLQSFADSSGKRKRVALENKKIIETIRTKKLDKPIILGYGINNPERVKEAIEVGPDGVIVGTAMIEKINTGDYGQLSSFISEMKEATLP